VRAESRLTKVASDPFTGQQVREEPVPYSNPPEVHA
jgi:hypothetical protein